MSELHTSPPLPDEHLPPETPSMVFHRLSQARTARGVTLEAMSDTLKIPAPKLKELEMGNLDKIGGIPMARPLVMSICRYLSLDPAPFLAQIPVIEAPRLESETRIQSNTVFPQQSSVGLAALLAGLRGKWWSVAGACIAIVVVVVLLLSRYSVHNVRHWLTKDKSSVEQPMAHIVHIIGPETSTMSPQETLLETSPAIVEKPVQPAVNVVPSAPMGPTEQPPVASPIGALHHAPPAPSAASTSVTSQVPIAIDTAVNSVNAVKDAAATAVGTMTETIGNTPAASVNASVQMVLAATSNAWVSVRNKENDSLFRGVLVPGKQESITWSNQAWPVFVTIGNAAAVSVLIHGKSFDLRPYQNKEVANFTLSH